MEYLKIGKATELFTTDRKLYRILEILPGFFSWFILIFLSIFSFVKPVVVAYFIIAFDVYWLLLVIFLGVYLLVSYRRLKQNLKINWHEKCQNLKSRKIQLDNKNYYSELQFDDIYQLIILPTYDEKLEVIKPSFQALIDCKYPLNKFIVILAIEERGGKEAQERAKIIEMEFGDKFYKFLITTHPDGIIGELKGKGANQAWAARQAKKEIIDKESIDYNKILVSVFDIDTIIYPDYFYCLTYHFLTAKDPYQSSYQPIPVYHNNIWQAPFFARVAASSNTFWQMMQQIRQEKLATYSSHSMTWRTLVEVDFWSTNMVSEDSRIFWHCFLFYNGNYQVVPLHYPVSMDVCMDDNFLTSAVNLYKQQRRWGWGVENIPYLIFNTIKRWDRINRRKAISRIFIQIYGFNSWATNALIIAFIGWLPLIFGGEQFNATVLSTNLPLITRTLMTFAMSGLVLSSILSTLLLPKKPKRYSILKNFTMIFQWLLLPISIIIFGAIPGLAAQTRLMFGNYLGFWVTPKSR